MNKIVNSVKDFLVGKPEQRFQDVAANLANIRSKINLTNEEINDLLVNKHTKLSKEQIEERIAELRIKRAELNKELIDKDEEKNKVVGEANNRKKEERIEKINEHQKAIEESTGQVAKKTAQALVSAKIAVREARTAMRNRTRSRPRTAGGKRKSQKKRRTNKRK